VRCDVLRHFDKLNGTLLRGQRPSESVNGAFPSTGSGTESAVESNWVVIQNFLTCTPLNENFLLVSFAIKSKHKLHSFTLPKEECLKTENYEL